MAYKLREAYSYNMNGFVTKLQKLRLLLFWFYLSLFIFVATTCTAKTEKYIVISTGEYFPFS